jgi:hypothetical protein
MTPHDLVSALRESIVEENSSIYRRVFMETKVEKAADPYWRNALTLFSELSVEQRESLFEVIRQVMVDTTSNVLGILDGVNGLRFGNNKFKLTEDGKTLNGDLQALFLAEEDRISHARE